MDCMAIENLREQKLLCFLFVLPSTIQMIASSPKTRQSSYGQPTDLPRR